MVRMIGTLAVSLILMASAAVVQADDCGDGVGPCSCGDTVTADTTLDASDPIVDPTMPCGAGGRPDDGLIVDGVALDLGANTITGSNSGTGLILVGAGGSVANGRIQRFGVGIGSWGTITGWDIVPELAGGLRVTSNGTGIEIWADHTDITDTAVSLSSGDGAVVRGDWNTISRISCSRNGDDGLVVKGDHNTLEHNVCDKNGDKGIFVHGNYNILVRNYGTGNLAGTGVLGIGDNNDFQTNRATNNGGNGVIGKGVGLKSNGRNYATGNRGGTNCHIDGFPTTGGGRYC